MKTSKKFIAGVSAVVMACSGVITVSAVNTNEATTDFAISVSSANKSVEQNGKFEITVDLANVPDTGVAGFQFAVSYDPSVLTYEGYKEGDIMGNAADVELGLVSDLAGSMVSSDKYSCLDCVDLTNTEGNSTGKIGCLYATGLTDSSNWITKDGTLVTFYFSAKEVTDSVDTKLSVGGIGEGEDVIFAGVNKDGGAFSYDSVNDENTNLDIEVVPTEVTTTASETSVSTDDTTASETSASTGDTTTVSETSVSTDDTTTASETTVDTDDTTTSETSVSTDDTSDTTEPSGETLLGDVNVDGKVSTSDLLAMKKHLLGTKEIEAGSQSFTNADINADGKVSTADLLSLKKYLLGIIENFN